MTFQEKLEHQKNEFGNDIQERLKKLQEDKVKSEQKYEEKRKQLKEIEKVTSQRIFELERENAVLHEKLANIERKMTDEIK